MTVVDEILDDNEQCFLKPNDIKVSIENNDPIEEKLHVIVVISNPCLYKRRYKLMKEFIERMTTYEKHIELYIVELAYGDQKFVITKPSTPNQLQLRTDVALWHKENMINLGVKYLLPANWKAFAWIDGDIEFEEPDWAQNTLKLLNGSKDIVQLFSHCVDMDRKENAMSIFSSFGFNYVKNKTYNAQRGINYWHPGYAWAMTRKSYEKIGGLFEESILGSGDYYMAMSIIKEMPHKKDLHKKMRNLRLGYVPGIIRHHYHGSKANRKYTDRWQILQKHNFVFNQHIMKDEMGLLVPTTSFSQEFKDDIMNYFMERKEDD